MNQQDYRNTDPITSRQGATNKPKRQAQALEMIAQHPGITAGGIGVQSGVPELWKRLSEMERKGLIQRDGFAFFEPTGKWQTKWKIRERQLGLGGNENG
tara:strand:+ start:609 stop:905 length:297 start_codon:yes stop_codon:yes gene_type:complete